MPYHLMNPQVEKMIRQLVDEAFESYMTDLDKNDPIAVLARTSLYSGVMQGAWTEQSKRTEAEFRELREKIERLERNQLQDATAVMQQVIPLMAATIGDDEIRKQLLELARGAVTSKGDIRFDVSSGGRQNTSTHTDINVQDNKGQVGGEIRND